MMSISCKEAFWASAFVEFNFHVDRFCDRPRRSNRGRQFRVQVEPDSPFVAPAQLGSAGGVLFSDKLREWVSKHVKTKGTPQTGGVEEVLILRVKVVCDVL